MPTNYVIAHQNGWLHNEHCRGQMTDEDPTFFDNERAACKRARMLTQGTPTWGSKAIIYADYGLYTQRVIGIADTGVVRFGSSITLFA